MRAQGYRAKLNSSNEVTYRASKVYCGISGGLTGTDANYPSLLDQKQKPRLSYHAGLFLEWRFFDKCSLGLDVFFANRKAGLAFNTPYLINYNETAVTNITYKMSINGLELNMPFTWYFGKPKTWFDSYTRFFAFVGPSFFLVFNGSLEWTRTHLIDNQVISSYQVPVSDHSIFPYDYGAVAGLGIVYKQKVRHYHFIAKCALSYYHGLSDTFSDAEKKLAVAHFYGLGDIQHEILGTRYFRQIRLSISFAMPFRDKPSAACRDFGIY